MKNKLISNLFSSGLQVIAIQIIGVVFFLITARFLPKTELGLFNWSNAVSSFIIILVGFGLDQSVTRRITNSKNSDWVAIAYLFHSFITSIITIGLMFLIYHFTANDKFKILPFVFISQAALYLGAPLRQFLNAKEQFTPYGVISIVSNLGKIVLALIFIKWGSFSIFTVINILIVASLFEFASLFIYIKIQLRLQYVFKFAAYTKLLKESIPLYISAIFDSSLSRMDWILLGFLSTGIMTAEYTVAYRGYEVAKLPLQIIGLIILPRFIRLLPNEFTLPDNKKIEIRNLLSIEFFFAMLVILCLNIIWQPWVGAVTGGKYGSSNALIFLILSLCLPVHFFINLLWTLCYAGKKYKQISTITVVIAITNIVLNLVLIPLYGGLGAAIAFLIATCAQAAAYYYIISRSLMHFSFTGFIAFTIIGIIAYIVATYITHIPVIQLLSAIVIYLLLSVLSKQVNKTHLENIKSYLKK